MPAYPTDKLITTPERVLKLTAPDGEFVIECFDLSTFDYQGMVKTFDPEFADGRGGIDFTRDKNEALRFKDFLGACDCWRMSSKKKPLREDRKPNRPMTAFTIQISKFTDAPKGVAPPPLPGWNP